MSRAAARHWTPKPAASGPVVSRLLATRSSSRPPSGRLGNRNRELRLHVLFLCWYCAVEPPFLTGLQRVDLPVDAIAATVSRRLRHVQGRCVLDDAGSLFIVGLMAQLAPWALGEDASTWNSRSATFRARYRKLLPGGLSPTAFAGRGASGEYFAGQVTVPGGF